MLYSFHGGSLGGLPPPSAIAEASALAAVTATPTTSAPAVDMSSLGTVVAAWSPAPTTPSTLFGWVVGTLTATAGVATCLWVAVVSPAFQWPSWRWNDILEVGTFKTRLTAVVVALFHFHHE
jgi:hypothetical protein